MSLTCSIFTPTHNTKHLLELYHSIQKQDYLEWVIFVNHGPSPEDIPSEIREDPRTKVVTNEYVSDNIGAIKKFACSQCTGQILIECDHDDEILPGIIDKIKEAFQDPEVVFAYTDCAEYNDDQTRSVRMYDAAYGWEYYDLQHEGYTYKVAVTPDAIPAHASIILFQANHVRAFRRSTYERIGGHDMALDVLDDQDLTCRLYVEGKFKHIKECGYLYRVHQDGSNTWLKRNAKIQEDMVTLQEKYIEPMAMRWSKEQGLRCLDLGGRIGCPEGYESLDHKDADVECDLEEEWPILDDSVGIIRAHDIIEHLHDTIHFFKEASRVLVPGGYIFISVPSTDDGGRGAFQDPLHVKFFNINSFFYYTRAAQARYIDTPVRFQRIILKNYYPSQWEIDNKIPYVKAVLLNLKGGYHSHGLIEI